MSSKQKWGTKEKTAWLAEQKIQRSYLDEVVTRLESLKGKFKIEQYGSLSYAPEKYPLYILKTQAWDKTKSTILITGGIHGYETSGVHGALRFVEKQALNYSDHFNFVIAPCVSPWGYETINRWNPNTVDPNRSFYSNGSSEESDALIDAISYLKTDCMDGGEITAHFDLHETTDTDNTTFLPALAARDAKPLIVWEIPDGFYLVGDSENPEPDFQRSMIESVKKVTHIAPSDEQGKIIGEPLVQPGVINYPTKKLGLCAGFSNAQYITTTEVYPDSPKVSDDDCINAQVAAITGGLKYLIENT